MPCSAPDRNKYPGGGKRYVDLYASGIRESAINRAIIIMPSTCSEPKSRAPPRVSKESASSRKGSPPS